MVPDALFSGRVQVPKDRPLLWPLQVQGRRAMLILALVFWAAAGSALSTLSTTRRGIIMRMILRSSLSRCRSPTAWLW